jgi:hypothetical protein
MVASSSDDTHISLNNLKLTWYGYEVSGIVLSRNFKGAMRLDRTKYMSVHVFASAGYDFNALTPIVWKLWL